MKKQQMKNAMIALSAAVMLMTFSLPLPGVSAQIAVGAGSISQSSENHTVTGTDESEQKTILVNGQEMSLEDALASYQSRTEQLEEQMIKLRETSGKTASDRLKTIFIISFVSILLFILLINVMIRNHDLKQDLDEAESDLEKLEEKYILLLYPEMKKKKLQQEAMEAKKAEDFKEEREKEQKAQEGSGQKAKNPPSENIAYSKPSKEEVFKKKTEESTERKPVSKKVPTGTGEKGLSDTERMLLEDYPAEKRENSKKQAGEKNASDHISTKKPDVRKIKRLDREFSEFKQREMDRMDQEPYRGISEEKSDRFTENEFVEMEVPVHEETIVAEELPEKHTLLKEPQKQREPEEVFKRRESDILLDDIPIHSVEEELSGLQIADSVYQSRLDGRNPYEDSYEKNTAPVMSSDFRMGDTLENNIEQLAREELRISELSKRTETIVSESQEEETAGDFGLEFIDLDIP